MSNFTTKLVGKLLPKATGKAAALKGRCYPGCGGDKVYRAAGSRQPIEKAPCC